MKILKTLLKKNLPKVDLLINEIEFIEYQNIYFQKNFFNISHIQSPGYYLIEKNHYYLKVIKKGSIVAIVSLFKKYYLFNLINLIRLNDGPLISEEYIKIKEDIINSILKFIKNKYGRLISLAPAYIYKNDNSFRNFITIKLNYFAKKTYIVDLLNSEEELHKNLKSNWRNKLKKGLGYSNTKEIFDLKSIKSILQEYKEYANKLKFTPISNKKCIQWVKNNKNNDKLLSLKIYQSFSKHNQAILGSIGILCFKDKALYLFGYTNEIGKKYQANTAMLWHAIIEIKKIGYKEFDLGGFNENTGKGIKKFKEGLNGTLRKTLGEYIFIRTI